MKHFCQDCLVTLPSLMFALVLSGCSGLASRPNSSYSTPSIEISADISTSTLSLPTSVDITAASITPTPALNPTIEGGAPTAPNVLRRLRAQLVDDGNCRTVAIEREVRGLARRPDALKLKIERALPLLEYVLAAVEQRNLPGQFALVPWAESGFRADPGNRGSVQGLWQFTESTGRAHGLRIDRRYDGRRAAIDSTLAAVEHLEALQQEFSDWRLALLAYNAGAFRVARAIRNHPLNAAGLPATLAPHSYVYLQKISALACILGDAQRHGLDTATLTFEPLVEVPRPLGISSARELARTSALTLAELLNYNAAFADGSIPSNAPPTLLLPERAARAVASIEANSSDLDEVHLDIQVTASPANTDQATDHLVTRGDNLWRIARLYRLKLRDLLRINNLSPRSVIRPGQRIRIVPD